MGPFALEAAVCCRIRAFRLVALAEPLKVPASAKPKGLSWLAVAVLALVVSRLTRMRPLTLHPLEGCLRVKLDICHAPVNRWVCLPLKAKLLVISLPCCVAISFVQLMDSGQVL